MATSKTGSFYLTETVSMAAATPADSRVQGTIDLGAYVDVGDQQAISIESVDFVWQRGTDFGNDQDTFLATTGSLGYQLCDLNQGTLFTRADDNTLIASGGLMIFSGQSANNVSDFYPDSFGKLDQSRLVVNDSLFLVVGNDGAITGPGTINGTVRIKCRIVKLSTKDWMAIAIQSTAADN
jgi:hypothetical protein